MSGRGKLKREPAARVTGSEAGRNLALAATLIVFAVFPIGMVSTMMLLQIFGVWGR